jgi:hypothetical protein
VFEVRCAVGEDVLQHVVKLLTVVAEVSFGFQSVSQNRKSVVNGSCHVLLLHYHAESAIKGCRVRHLPIFAVGLDALVAHLISHVDGLHALLAASLLALADDGCVVLGDHLDRNLQLLYILRFNGFLLQYAPLLFIKRLGT